MDAYDEVLQLAKAVSDALQRTGIAAGRYKYDDGEESGWYIHTLYENRYEDPDPIPGYPPDTHGESRQLVLNTDGKLRVYYEAFQKDYNAPLWERKSMSDAKAHTLMELDGDEKPFTVVTHKLEQARYRGR